MTFASSFAAAFGLALIAASPAASCGQGAFAPSTEAHLEPMSVPASEIGAWLTASPYSSGIRFTSEMRGRDLWLDVTDFPERAPEIGSVRALMQLGRVVDTDFDRLVLADGQEAFFAIAEEDLRSVGCQFVWPINTGSDPIQLMSSIVEALRDEEGGRVLEGLSSAGTVATTVQAMAVVKDRFNPAWIASARPGATVPDSLDHMVGFAAPRVQAAATPFGEAIVLGGL